MELANILNELETQERGLWGVKIYKTFPRHHAPGSPPPRKKSMRPRCSFRKSVSIHPRSAPDFYGSRFFVFCRNNFLECPVTVRSRLCTCHWKGWGFPREGKFKPEGAVDILCETFRFGITALSFLFRKLLWEIQQLFKGPRYDNTTQLVEGERSYFTPGAVYIDT